MFAVKYVMYAELSNDSKAENKQHIAGDGIIIASHIIHSTSQHQTSNINPGIPLDEDPQSQIPTLWLHRRAQVAAHRCKY